jgi:hypothetical protein
MNKPEEERQTHESFGQISFHRVSCSGNQQFYGSELPQSHYIQMEVVPSEIIRDLSYDRYFGYRSPIISVRMTAGQFSEMITSMNQGSGTCCTIEQIEDRKIQPMPIQESRKEFMHRKFEERMKMFADTIRSKQQEAKRIVKKKTLSKDDVHNLSHLLEWLTTEVENNIPYFATCFQETMDEVVFEAKLEVENAIQHKINVLGIDSLKLAELPQKPTRTK